VSIFTVIRNNRVNSRALTGEFGAERPKPRRPLLLRYKQIDLILLAMIFIGVFVCDGRRTGFFFFTHVRLDERKFKIKPESNRIRKSVKLTLTRRREIKLVVIADGDPLKFSTYRLVNAPRPVFRPCRRKNFRLHSSRSVLGRIRRNVRASRNCALAYTVSNGFPGNFETRGE